MEFPTISIHESFAYPTSMYLRNLMALDTEEMIRAQPVDAVVLIGGCDKTIPAQLMAAASVDVPAIVIPTGPMLTRTHQGERLGACTDCRRYWARFRAGRDRSTCHRRGQRAARADRRHLHGDGDGKHDRMHDRSDGHEPAGRSDHPRSARRAPSPRRSLRRAGGGTRPIRPAVPTAAVRGSIHQRAGGPACDRRLDQRADPPDRDRRAPRRPHRSRRIRCARPQGPGAGRSQAVRAALHGAPARSRRIERGAARVAAVAASRRADRCRQDSG